MPAADQTSNEPKHLLLRAAKGLPVPRPPIWAMRQAGRWDPEFNRVRAGLSFYEFSENVERSVEASLLPKRFGVDAIILFYDITTLTVAMGLPFVLQPSVGPVPQPAIRTLSDVAKLDREPDPERFAHIRKLLQLTRAALHDELPVIVFAGAPFTLATYCIGTGKDMVATRRFIAEQPTVWETLLDKLTYATSHFLRVLVSEGASIYQLFDSWAGLLTREEYLRYAQPQHQAVLGAVANVPRILFVKECPYLDLLTQTGADVISLGVQHDLAQARQQYPQLAFQGNVDQEVLRTGTPEQVAECTRKCLQQGGGQRHIVNLSHGVDKATPVANFQAYIDAAKSWRLG